MRKLNDTSKICTFLCIVLCVGSLSGCGAAMQFLADGTDAVLNGLADGTNTVRCISPAFAFMFLELFE